MTRPAGDVQNLTGRVGSDQVSEISPVELGRVGLREGDPIRPVGVALTRFIMWTALLLCCFRLVFYILKSRRSLIQLLYTRTYVMTVFFFIITAIKDNEGVGFCSLACEVVCSSR